MNISKKVTLIAALIVFASAFAGCNNPGPAERTGKKIDDTAEKAGEVMGDSAITTKVKASILAEPGLRSLQISVDTIQGVVTLSGAVDSQKDIDRAEEVANTIAGVKDVRNQLTIK